MSHDIVKVFRWLVLATAGNLVGGVGFDTFSNRTSSRQDAQRLMYNQDEA